MKSLLHTTLWTGLLATLLVAVPVSLFFAWLYSEGLPPGTVVTIDHERFVVPEIVSAGQWLLVALGVLALSLAIVVVTPLLVVVGVGMPLLAGAAGIAVALLMLTLLLVPLVWLARRWFGGKRKTGSVAA